MQTSDHKEAGQHGMRRGRFLHSRGSVEMTGIPGQARNDKYKKH